MIAGYGNCDEKHFASASAYPKRQRDIETAKLGRAEWREREHAAQEAGIAIEAEEDVESVVDEADIMAEKIDSPAGGEPATMELTADKKEDTDEYIEDTISEYLADAGVDSA